jgi:hypothetical protein
VSVGGWNFAPVIPILVIGAVVLLGCADRHGDSAKAPSEQTTSGQPAWFADATTESHLAFSHDPGPVDGQYFLPQINGSGAALFDANNDGLLDIYLLQGGGPGSSSTNPFFHQRPDGTFEDLSQQSGLDISGTNNGVAIGDVNNDGWIDVLVTQYLDVKLFLNQDGAHFHDVTSRSRLTNPSWGTSASFLDYDRDGWLDLVIANYVVFDDSRRCTIRGGKQDFCRPNIFSGTDSRLYRNLGVDDAENWLGYQDVTQAAGLARQPGAGLGVTCADFSGDHWPDIFIANDMQANRLWVNQKNGTFLDEAIARGVALNSRGESLSNMGAACGDVDGDGLLDIFVTVFTNERHALWKQGPRGSFVEKSAISGLTQSQWHGTGWGTVMGDFDQNGALDLALVNGYVDRRDVPAKAFWDGYADRNQLFANDGEGRFSDVSSDNPDLCGQPNVGRGLCVGDIDGDGALDLLVTQIGGPARILRNIAPNRGHWLLVRAVDPKRRSWSRPAADAGSAWSSPARAINAAMICGRTSAWVPWIWLRRLRSTGLTAQRSSFPAQSTSQWRFSTAAVARSRLTRRLIDSRFSTLQASLASPTLNWHGGLFSTSLSLRPGHSSFCSPSRADGGMSCVPPATESAGVEPPAAAQLIAA